jgi:HK97 gp10 family phage protein
MTTRVYGLGGARRAILEVNAKVRAAAGKASEAGATVVAREIQARAPRASGATAASVRVDVDGDTAHTGPSTSYARFPEYGTRYIAGQHYVADAADAASTGAAAAIAAVLKSVIE